MSERPPENQEASNVELSKFHPIDNDLVVATGRFTFHMLSSIQYSSSQVQTWAALLANHLQFFSFDILLVRFFFFYSVVLELLRIFPTPIFLEIYEIDFGSMQAWTSLSGSHWACCPICPQVDFQKHPVTVHFHLLLFLHSLDWWSSWSFFLSFSHEAFDHASSSKYLCFHIFS